MNFSAYAATSAFPLSTSRNRTRCPVDAASVVVTRSLVPFGADDGPGVAERNTLHDRRVPPQALLRFRADVAFKGGERGRLGLICHAAEHF